MSEDRRQLADTFGDFEAFADIYVRTAESNAFNAMYERPAMRAAIGDVSGLDVVDAGSGGGELAAWLLDNGARRVSAFDVSPRMVALARERLPPQAEVQRLDLRESLDQLPGGAFDLVVSSLTLHYVRDWSLPLAEFRRLLRPGGRLIFSTHHPFTDVRWGSGDYFATELIEQEWTEFGQTPRSVRFYRRPLNAIAEALVAEGFIIERFHEPRPLPEMLATEPKLYALLQRQPWFLNVTSRRGP